MTSRHKLAIAGTFVLASIFLAFPVSAKPTVTRELVEPAAVTAPRPRTSTPAVREAIGRIMNAVRAQATPNLNGFTVPPALFAHVR